MPNKKIIAYENIQLLKQKNKVLKNLNKTKKTRTDENNYTAIEPLIGCNFRGNDLKGYYTPKISAEILRKVLQPKTAILKMEKCMF